MPLPVFDNVKSLIKKALKNIFKKKIPSVDPDLWQVAFQTLDHAVGTAQIEYNKPNFLFTKMLRDSAAQFAAKKTYAQSKELAALAASKPGYQITWKEFLEKARPIVKNYNETWLKTEYNTAIRKARQAAQWDRYYEQIHLYPNLKYLPSRAATPRKEHKKYYFVVRPVDDNFWIHHTPPIDWNCLCGVEQTDEPVTPLPQQAPEPSAGLDNNPALTGQLFSDNHPYDLYTKEAQEQIRQRAIQLKQQADYAELLKNQGYESSFDMTRDKVQDWPSINHHELASVHWYSREGYTDLNSWKRNERRATRYLEAFADTLTTALEKLPTWSGVTYRKVQLTKKNLEVYQQALENGKTVQHNYYTSSAKSMSGVLSGNTLFMIEVKQGVDIEKISYFPNEEEVLLTAGAKFEVIEMTESNGEHRIRLRQLDQ